MYRLQIRIPHHAGEEIGARFKIKPPAVIALILDPVNGVSKADPDNLVPEVDVNIILVLPVGNAFLVEFVVGADSKAVSTCPAIGVGDGAFG